MFLVVDSESDETLPLDDPLQLLARAMNCPSARLIYKMGRRSYRELPLRYYTTNTLHRGLGLAGRPSPGAAVRAGRTSHIYLMESQIADEVQRIVDLMEEIVYGAFGLEFGLKFSTRPPNPEERIGDDALWDKAEGAAQGGAGEGGDALGAQPRGRRLRPEDRLRG